MLSSRTFPRHLLIVLLVVLLTSSVTHADLQQPNSDNPITDEVASALASNGTANVIIGLKQTSPLLEQPFGQMQDQTLARLGRTIEVRHRFNSSPTIAGTISSEALALLQQDESIAFVELDQPIHVHGNGRDELGAGAIHQRNYTGEGVVVAVLDTGIDPLHPNYGGLIDDVLVQQCITHDACYPYGDDTSTSAESAQPHGTIVASIITDPELGYAPDAQIIPVRVMDDAGVGFLSDWLAGLEWVRDNRQLYGIDVVNLSLGTFTLYPPDCGNAPDMPEAFDTVGSVINDLVNQDVTIFVSSGNNGDPTNLPAPACFDGVIPVGATYAEDMGIEPDTGDYSDLGFNACTDNTTSINTIACFTNLGDGSVELAAPGVHSYINVDGVPSRHAGTSYASPVAAGVAALMLQANPGLSPQGIEGVLTQTGNLTTGLPLIIDALAAFNNVETSLACGGHITTTADELMDQLATAIEPTALITICLDPNAEFIYDTRPTNSPDQTLFPLIAGNVTIYGNGSTLTRDTAGEQFRFFDVAASGILTLHNMTISEGHITDLRGGAIFSFGSLYLYDVNFFSNEARCSDPSSATDCATDDVQGGAVAAHGVTYITDSTFDSNLTDRYAGALFGGPSSSVAIYRSTFTRNAATYVDPGFSNGIVSSEGTLVRTANTIYTRSNGRVDDRCPDNPRYCMGLLIHDSVFDSNIGGGSVIEAHNGDYGNASPSASVVGNVFIRSSIFTNNDGRPVSKNRNSLLWIEDSLFENHENNIENNNVFSYAARIPIKPNGGCCTEPNRLDLNAMIWNTTIRGHSDCVANYGTMMILSSTLDTTCVNNLQRSGASDSAALYIEQSFLNQVSMTTWNPHSLVMLNSSMQDGGMIAQTGSITNSTFVGTTQLNTYTSSSTIDLTLKNIIAASTAFCGTVNDVSTGGEVYLLTTDSSCDGQLSGTTQVTISELDLQPAAFNGGQTPTYAVGVNSAATQGGSGDCLSVGGTFTVTIDQRGYDRKTDQPTSKNSVLLRAASIDNTYTNCDVGAFDGPPPPPVPDFVDSGVLSQPDDYVYQGIAQTGNPEDDPNGCIAESLEANGNSQHIGIQGRAGLVTTAWGRAALITTAGGDQFFEIDTDGSSYDTIIGVFTGEGDLSSLILVSCAGDGEPSHLILHIPEEDVENQTIYRLIVWDEDQGTAGDDLSLKIDDITFTGCLSIEGISPVECESLLTLYAELDGDNWQTSGNDHFWFGTNRPCDTWLGITCTNGVISGIDLTGITVNGDPIGVDPFVHYQGILSGNQNLPGNDVIFVNTGLMDLADDGLCTLPEAVETANTGTASGILTGECQPNTIGTDGSSNPIYQIMLSPSRIFTLDRAFHESSKAGLYVESHIIIQGDSIIDPNTNLPRNSIIERSLAPDTEIFKLFVVEDGQLTLNNVILRFGQTGVELTSGNLTINDSTIRDSITDGGGLGQGIFIYSGMATISDSLITENGSIGIGNRGGTSLIIENSIVHNNGSHGISISPNPLLTPDLPITIRNSQITSNNGTGILLPSYTSARNQRVIENTVIGGNVAVGSTSGFDGAGVFINNTIRDNIGQSNISGDSLLFGNLIVGNEGDVCSSSPPTSNGYNITDDATCGFNATGDVESATETDAQLMPLAFNGGSILTYAIGHDSIAIDAIPAASCTVVTDARGISRPIDEDGDGNADCDIGAFERQRTPPVVVDDAYNATYQTPLFIGAFGGVLSNDVDVNNDGLTALLQQGPINGELDLNPDGSFTYTPTDGFMGGDGFTYSATNGFLTSASVATVTINVGSDPTSPPPTPVPPTTLSLLSPGDQIDYEGEFVYLPIQATNPDNLTLTYSASGLPTGLSIEPTSGLIIGSITPNASDSSPFSVTVTSQGANNPTTSSSLAFGWHITKLPDQQPA